MVKKTRFGKLISKIKNKIQGNSKKPKKISKKLKRKPIKIKKVAPKKAIRKNGKSIKKTAVSLYGKPIGEVTHYFTKIKVGIIKLKDNLKLSDSICVKGATTDFKQEVKSMQIDHQPVNQAKKGQEIGILVKSRVRQGDGVYLP